MSTSTTFPIIIQGGMGVAVSHWRLARAVAQTGQLGVVSSVALSRILASRLADGDLGGHMRRALDSLPLPGVARRILDRYLVPGGKPPGAPYPNPPAYTIRPPKFLDQLTVIANYIEVWLAKEGHAGPVGVNLLEKIQLPNLASLYGAMLAGVDYVLIGAGIPTQFAALLDQLAEHRPVSYRLDVRGAAPEDDIRIHLDPERLFPGVARLFGALRRPKFLPIISSATLAQALIKRSEGAVDGFVIEGPTAGGHNAPPRGPLRLNERGEPLYGEKDMVDTAKIAQLGLPFWLAGGYGHVERLQAALAAGAAGVQVGTAFALCEESGMEPSLRQRLLALIGSGGVRVLTNAVVSPTGFPFKVAQMEGTVSDEAVYRARRRVCDVGLLRSLFRKKDGAVGYRCPAEPEDDYVRKGGDPADTAGRVCLCNQLLATAGYPQRRADGSVEPPIITLGDDLDSAARFLRAGASGYTAADVVRGLLGALDATPRAAQA